jgi:hypothetical protein
MNSRIQSSNIGKDTSFGEKSVTKPSSKSKTASHPHIAVEISNKDVSVHIILLSITIILIKNPYLSNVG